MNLKSVFALLAAGTFLVACGADEVVNSNDEAKEKATVTIKVVDNHDGSPIAEAKVYSVVDDDEEMTDEFGLATWKKQVLGNHVFQVSKKGYATIQTRVTVEEKGMGDVARVPDVVAQVDMYKTGVNAKGTVLYVDDEGNKKAAAGVVVYASLPAVFVPSEIADTTDKNGEYVFANLPEGVAIDIAVGQKEFDKKKYSVAAATPISVAGQYRAGDVVKAPILTMTPAAGEVVLVNSNLSKIDTNTNITLTFSSELVADSVKDNWRVSRGGTDVLTTATLSSDKKTITIAPVSKTWTKGSTYTVYGTAYSVDGGVFYASNTGTNRLTFEPGSGSAAKAPENLSGLKAVADEDDAGYFVVSWTAPKGSDVVAYNFYYKTNKMNDYEFYTQFDLFDITENSITLRESRFSGTGVTKVSFIVLPENASGLEADVSKAKAVEYKFED